MLTITVFEFTARMGGEKWRLWWFGSVVSLCVYAWPWFWSARQTGQVCGQTYEKLFSTWMSRTLLQNACWREHTYIVNHVTTSWAITTHKCICLLHMFLGLGMLGTGLGQLYAVLSVVLYIHLLNCLLACSLLQEWRWCWCSQEEALWGQNCIDKWVCKSWCCYCTFGWSIASSAYVESYCTL